MTTFASFTTSRDWPWRDGDLLGWPGLVIAAAVLILLTLWTYAGQRSVGWGKLLAVLGLRLAALAVVGLLLLRPSFASEEEVVTPGRLILVLDHSLSMKISDAPGSSTRWDFVRRLLEMPDVKDALQRLQRDRQIDIVFYQAAEGVRKFDPRGDADGKRTDIGKWLNWLMSQHRNDRNLRGLLLFTDGADNGTAFSVLGEAAAWRELPCPIHCFGVGTETNNKGQRDVAIVEVMPDQDMIFVKNEVTIKAVIDAPNLEGQNVTVRMFVDGQPAGVKENVALPLTRGNVIDVGKFVPEHVGEVKVTVKIDEVPGEFTTLNNEMSTYINVRKEGLSILWVEGRQRLETTWILRHALKKNPRFSITFDERLKDGPLTPSQAEFFKTPEKSFDVVVIGDISATRFAGGDNILLERIAKSVSGKQTGLLFLGGYQTDGTSDWLTTGKSLSALLPADLIGSGHHQGKVRPLPVDANKGHRLLQLGVPTGKDLWGAVPDAANPENPGIFQALKGQVKLGKLKTGAVPLLATEEGEIFVATKDDGPRVAVFGGADTYARWTASADAMPAFERFWTQLMIWLARQDEGNNQLWVKLDKRRLAVGASQKLGFSVGAEGKDGLPLKNVRYRVMVQGPGGEMHDVTTALRQGVERGLFDKASASGEYKVIVNATATGPQGQEMVLDAASARFLGYAEDVENQQPAANHKDLLKLAAAGGGMFRIAGREELLQYLNDLSDRGTTPGWIKRDVWPNWKTPPVSGSMTDQLGALMQSLALPCLVLFVLCVGTEWFLRRWWGLV